MDDKIKRPPERGYDGVIYTPGSAARQNGSYRAPSSQRTATAARKVGVKRKKKKHKSQYGVFLAATLFTGVVVCIIVFAITVNSIMNQAEPNKQNAAVRTPPQEAQAPEIIPVADKADNLTGIVKSIGEQGQLTVYDFNTGKNLNLIADNLSLLKNKYGEPIVFAEISAGDIVDVEYAGNVIRELFFSRQAVEYKNISNVKIDAVEQTITIGNENFSYNDQLITFSKGGELDLSQIKPLDVISVKF